MKNSRRGLPAQSRRQVLPTRPTDPWVWRWVDGALYVSDDVKGRIWRIIYPAVSATPAIARAAPILE